MLPHLASRRLAEDPAATADVIESEFAAGAVDGYLLPPPPLPEQRSPFNELVLPLLRRRGLFRHDYTDDTLRAHLGLARPARRRERAVAR
ncbi:hypothetical protein [Mycobacterium sp. MUNTM1]